MNKIISDVDADQLMDNSFLAIGGHTNHKSVDVFDNEENRFLDFGQESIVSKESGDPNNYYDLNPYNLQFNADWPTARFTRSRPSG